MKQFQLHFLVYLCFTKYLLISVRIELLLNVGAESVQTLHFCDIVSLAFEVTCLNERKQGSEDLFSHVSFDLRFHLDHKVIGTIFAGILLNLIIVRSDGVKCLASSLPNIIVLICDNVVKKEAHATHTAQIQVVLLCCLEQFLQLFEFVQYVSVFLWVQKRKVTHL